MRDCSRDENCRGITQPCDVTENHNYSSCGYSPPNFNYNAEKVLEWTTCTNAAFYEKSISL